MATVIQNKRDTVREIPSFLWELFSDDFCQELLQASGRGGRIEEIRIRCGRRACLTVSSGSVALSYVFDRREMDELVLGLCKGSLYAYRESIAKGYLSLLGGVRVGICGRASVEGDRIVGVYDVDGLNIRLPSGVLPVGGVICRRLREKRGGVLIYAPPGEGKTTLLRSVAAEMSRGDSPWRVALIDSRGEIFAGMECAELSMDVLTGYPRAKGVEIALRTMNPQLIVCDEIGEEEEAEAILRAGGAGVPFLATAHGGVLPQMLARSSIRRLHEARIFEDYVGIRREFGRAEYAYRMTEWEDANGLLSNQRHDAGPF